ncbi:hypothetical protein D3C71_1976790 [compost metagenome]
MERKAGRRVKLRYFARRHAERAGVQLEFIAEDRLKIVGHKPRGNPFRGGDGVPNFLNRRFEQGSFTDFWQRILRIVFHMILFLLCKWG